MNKKVTLAYSGGLDTSYCIKYLQNELNLEVHAVLINTGGFTKEEITDIGAKARDLGAASFLAIDQVQVYYEKVIKYLVFGNVLKNSTYPLSVSAERTVQALAIANYAVEINADYIAHGSTGAGNDQVRFDIVFQTIAPSIEILTPIRDQQLSREAEIAYLQQHGVEASWEKSKYSINKGLWGTSVGGVETLSSHLPLPESAWPSQLEKSDPETISVSFEEGELSALNGKALKQVEIIERLNEQGGQFAIGRDVHVGDTVIGIKGRVGFEAPGALMAIKAHHLLEKHTQSKWQQYWKEQLSNWYGMMLHEAQFLDPVMRNIEVFLEDTQKLVSGTVEIVLSPYNFILNGVESEFDLMNDDFGTYGEMNSSWSGEDVKGFTKILGNQLRLNEQRNTKL